jgi:hypothetical protein
MNKYNKSNKSNKYLNILIIIGFILLAVIIIFLGLCCGRYMALENRK